MLLLHFRQITQQFADGSVSHVLDCTPVKAECLKLHDGRLLAHRLNPERAHQPHRPAVHKTPHILATNEWNMLPKALPVSLSQAAAVSGFFRLHFLEHLGRGRIGLPQAFGEVSVNPAVFLFERDGQGKNLSFGKVFELFCHDLLLLPDSTGAPWGRLLCGYLSIPVNLFNLKRLDDTLSSGDLASGS